MDILNRPYIPDSEFKERAQRLQAIMKRENVDIFLAYGNEAEPAYSRYLCDYWPSFESCGVVLAQEGDPILLIGPESMTFAADRSRVPDNIGSGYQNRREPKPSSGADRPAH